MQRARDRGGGLGACRMMIFKRDAQGVILAAFMFLLHPARLANDTFVYRFRQRRKQAR